MKHVLLLCALALPFIAFSQEGVYLTLQDFKDGKLTDQTDDLRCMGATVVVRLGKVKKTYKNKEIWGYRRSDKNMSTDYRMIDGFGCAIYAKGEIWIYLGQRDHFMLQKDSVVFIRFKQASTELSNSPSYKNVSTYDYPYASRGVDGRVEKITSMKQLLSFLNPSADFLTKAKKGDEGSTFVDIMESYNKSKNTSLPTH
jgi:hypothetical protein